MVKLKAFKTLMLVLLILGGCSMNPKTNELFSSKEKLDKFALSEMKKKYNQDFAITKDNDYVEKSKIYGCIMKSKDNKFKDIYVTISPAGQLMDTLPNVYFKERAEKISTDLLKTKKYIKKYTVTFASSYSTKKWQPTDDLESFLKDVKGRNELEIYFEDGLSYEQYANQVEDLLKSLMKLPINNELNVFIRDKISIYWTALTDKSTLPSHKRILEKIKSNEHTSELIKDDF